MEKEGFDRHPGIDILDRFRAGLLDESVAEEIERHLSVCPFCRLELKRLRRFEEIDGDSEFLEGAGWEDARGKLDEVFREEVIPDVLGSGGGKGGSVRLYRLSKWLAPVAAAAVIAVIFLQIEWAPSDMESMRGGPLRGDGVGRKEIVIEKPCGEISACPDSFVWKSKGEFVYFTVEVFSARLESVYRSDKIKGNVLLFPDSLCHLFERHKYYIWDVKGYGGMDRVSVSGNEWFKITLPEDTKQKK